jgi:hypothetical protein
MPNYFRIKDLAGFEGLIMKSEDSKEEYDNVLCASSFFDQSDESVVDLPDGSVYVAARFLEPISYYDFAQLTQVKEQVQRLIGKYLYEGTFTKKKLNVAYTVYENSISVTIFELHDGGKQNTIYTQNFFSEKMTAIKYIEYVMTEKSDPEDLVFALRDLKDSELLGDQ